MFQRISRHRTFALAGAIAVLGAAFPLAACSDDDGSIGIEIAPTTLNLAPGGTGTGTINITRENGFSGPVLVARTGGPDLIVTTFSPAAIPNPDVESDFTVTVGEAVPAGTYELTLSAAGDGVATVSRTLTVVVGVPE